MKKILQNFIKSVSPLFWQYLVVRSCNHYYKYIHVVREHTVGIQCCKCKKIIYLSHKQYEELKDIK